MAFQVPASGAPQADPASRSRPTTVTASAFALIGQTAAGLVIAVIAVISLTRVGQRYTELVTTDATGYDKSQYLLTVRIYCIVLIAYSIVVGVVTAILALSVLRGSRVARALIWVSCGLLTLGGCCGTGALGLSREMKFGTGSPPSVAELVGTVPWAVMLLLTLAQTLLMILSGALLLAKPSARFFAAARRPAHH